MKGEGVRGGPGGFTWLPGGSVGAEVRSRREAEASRRADAVALLVEARRVLAVTRADADETVARVACEVAGVILGREAAAGGSVVRDVARRALERLPRARGVVLRVHPEDEGEARAGVRSWLPEGLAPEVLEVLADPEVERGGVVVDTELGRVDARLSVQLTALRRALAPGSGGR